jgi:hypothetical protein
MLLRNLYNFIVLRIIDSYTSVDFLIRVHLLHFGAVA